MYLCDLWICCIIEQICHTDFNIIIIRFYKYFLIICLYNYGTIICKFIEMGIIRNPVGVTKGIYIY